MGSYSSFYIGEHEAFSVKNGIDGLLLSLFRPADRVVRKVSVEQATSEGYEPVDEPEDGDISIYQYCSTAKAIRDRLDLMGITLDHTKKVFESCMADRLAESRSTRDEGLPTELQEHYRSKAQALEALTYEHWTAGFARIHRGELDVEACSAWGRSPLDDFPVTFMLEEDRLDGHYGFATYDSRIVLRAMLEQIPDDLEIVLDLTDLVLGGWYDVQDDLRRDADDLVVADYHTSQRIIILTEGSSDKRMLEAAIRVLCPHLADYFAFMNFDQMAIPGGAGTLVGFLKAFAGVGVINRVLAVFDNDTAASAALRAISGIRLPPNIGYTQLPALVDLAGYPTIGPTGLAPFDVNGLAGSLELYCGADVLTREDGALAPVHWKGFDAAMQQYHGEVMGKPRILVAFLAKAESASTASAIQDADWNGMRTVVAHIRERAALLTPYVPPGTP